jgi:hypothetical protein
MYGPAIAGCRVVVHLKSASGEIRFAMLLRGERDDGCGQQNSKDLIGS